MIRSSRILSGKVYVKKKDEAEWTLLGTIKETQLGMNPKTHRLCKQVCKHLRMSYDENHCPTESCHHPDNRPDGASWGECSPMSCPLARYEK